MTLLTTAQEALMQRITTRKARVAVMGLGYVGLPLALAMAESGFPVLGFEPSTRRTLMLQEGQSYIDDISHETLQRIQHEQTFKVSSATESLSDAEIVVVCVPTPLNTYRQPDLSYIESALTMLQPHVKEGMCVILESTTYPGTTDEYLVNPLSKAGWEVGKQVFVGYSPERVDPSNPHYHVANTKKVVAGATTACGDIVKAFYQQFITEVHQVSSLKTAEFTKLYENTFRAVNIALTNEMAQACDVMGIDIWEALEAAYTKPYGIMPFWPGPGIGGHCIPIDPLYLSWKLQEKNVRTRMIELAHDINSEMPHFVREKTMRLLGQQGKPLYQANILVLGVGYKPNVSDWRESPAQRVISIFEEDGANISYYDSLVPEFESHHGKQYSSLPTWSSEVIASHDIVVLMTPHAGLDYTLLVQQTETPVLDTRNALRGMGLEASHIINL
ncbi:MAG: nucleotide sugar dehydrogenase [Vampirovibrionales bacterium]